MKAKKIIILFFIIFLNLNLNKICLSAVKGSESLVSIEPNFIFPALDIDNKMLGFGWFKNGFALEDNLTSCTFDSVYPVCGNVNLNGGTLYLAQDLYFKNSTNIIGLGKIFGNNHFLDLCPSIKLLPAGRVEFRDLTIHLSCDLVLTDSVIFSGNCKIFGDGYDIIFADNGKIIVDQNSSLHLSEVILQGVKTNNFIVTDNTSSLVFENIRWKQADHYVFNVGSIKFLNQNDFIGSYSFVYESSLTSTICKQSSWDIKDRLCLSIGRSGSTNSPEPICFEDSTSALNLKDCTFFITDYGLNLKTGKMYVEGDVTLDIVGTTTQNGIILGTASAIEDCKIYFSSTASLKLIRGMFAYNNYSSKDLIALSDSARILRYGDSQFYALKDLTYPNMVLNVVSGAPATFLSPGVSFYYDNTKLIFGTSFEYDFKGRQSGMHNFYLYGNDHLYLTKGTYILPLAVFGAGNKIYGTGDLGGYISLGDQNSELLFDLNGAVVSNINLNGGKIKLAGDLTLGVDKTFTGAGIVDLASYNLNMSNLDSLWTSTISWKNVSGAITLNSNVKLSGKWTFDNSCIINGNGHTIDVGDTGKIFVNDGAELTFRNVVLHMVSQGDIKCLSNNSSIILDNTSWVQDSDVTFSLGSLKFVNAVDFIGSYSFIYDTNCTCTIAPNSTWNITGGMYAYLGKKSAGSLEPIYMQDSTSKLKLDDCSFFVTGDGMCLKKGNIDVNKNVNLEIAGQEPENGLIFGTGNPEDNVVTYFSSGCEFNFRSGQLVYNNTINNGLVALSEGSSIIRYADSKFHVMSDLIFPALHLKLFSETPVTSRAEGVRYSYNKSHINLENAEFDFKGQQDSSTVFLLQGNDYIYMSKGAFTLPILVSNKLNQIFGSGDVSGQISLQDSNTDLSFNLNGLLLGDININGGNIKLDGNLDFGGTSKINGLGTISLKNYNVGFGYHDVLLTSTIDWECGCGGTCQYCNQGNRSINLSANLSLAGQWRFKNSCTINGNGNTLNINNSGKIIIDDGVKLVLKNLSLKLSDSDSIVLVGDNSSIELDNVTWIQDSDFTLTKGSFNFVNDVSFVGAYSFIYDSVATSTITKNSSWKISKDMKLYIGKKDAQSSGQLIYMQDSTSLLKLENCSFNVTDFGLQFLTGKVLIDKDVELSIAGTDIASGLILGDGQNGHDVTVCLSSGACLHFKAGQMVYNNYVNDKITALSESAIIIRYGPSMFHMSTDLVFPAANLKVASGLPTTTRANENTKFTYNKSHLSFDNVEFDFSGKQDASSTFLLEGNGYLYLSKGVFALPFFVSGLGNQIFGTGNVSGTVALANNNTELSYDLNGTVWNNIALNGGVISLNSDLALGGNCVIDGPGQVRLMKYNVILGGQESIWTSTINWHSNGISLCQYNYPRGIDLNSKVNLTGKWNIQDNCTIDGHGNMLDLGEFGKIEVRDGVRLTFKNMILHTSGENNISCVGDNSTIVFDDVKWIQDADVTFAKGRMKFINDVEFTGVHSFIYDSCQTSSIDYSSSWKISSGMDFHIGKKTEQSLEPLYFEDSSSILKLDNCTFAITGSGMNFTRGKLDFERDVFLDVIGTTTSNGFIFGNTVESEDPIFQLNAGSNLHFRKGMFVYNTYSKNGFKALAENATIIRYGGSSAYIARDWTMPTLIIKAALGFPETLIKLGVNLRYVNTKLTFSESYFEYTGSQSAEYGYFVMQDNDYIFIDKGAFVFPVAITGKGNRIYGAGGFNGPIMLQGPQAELMFAINGTLGENIYVNGGKLILGDDLYLTGGTSLVGAGRVDLAGYKLALGGKDLIWDSPYFWSGESSSCIDITSKLDLRSTWTLSGTFTINGYGNIIDLANGGDIVVDKGSNVILRDVKITGISGNKIRCLGDDSIITLDDACLVQDNNFTFNTGALRIKNDVKMEGPYEFSYQSTSTSIILSDSSWVFGSGFKFNYDQALGASKDLISMQDDTSVLVLNGATLNVSANGINLTNGKLSVKKDSYLSSQLTTTLDSQDYEIIVDGGITFGSSDSLHDLVCDIYNGVTLHLFQGSLNYKNISSSACRLGSFASALSVHDNCKLNLYENLNLGIGSLILGNKSFIGKSQDKSLTGSIRPQGVLFYVDI